MTASYAHAGMERIITKLVAAVLQNVPVQTLFLSELYEGLEVIYFF